VDLATRIGSFASRTTVCVTLPSSALPTADKRRYLPPPLWFKWVAPSTSAAHSDFMNVWSDAEWLTLQFGPVWVISALLGRSHFDELEQEAFWRAVEDAPIGESALPWQLMQAIRRSRDWLLDEFMLDDRSIITGLSQVTSLLERVPLDVSRETREAILRVGSGMALARGPFGRRITDHDAQTLELLAQLLESTAETAANNPLNSDVAL
jgi:hypothetical protein